MNFLSCVLTYFLSHYKTRTCFLNRRQEEEAGKKMSRGLQLEVHCLERNRKDSTKPYFNFSIQCGSLREMRRPLAETTPRSEI